MIESSDSTRAMLPGVRLAKMAGWGDAPLNAVREDLVRLTETDARWLPEHEQPLTCATLERWKQQLETLARDGALSRLRRARFSAKFEEY